MAGIKQPTIEVIGERKVNWWLVAGGLVLLVFALGTLAFPALFLEAVTILAGAGFLFSGISGLVTFGRVRDLPGAGWTAVLASLDFVIGAMMLAHPVALASTIPWLLGVAFVVFGIIEIIGTTPLGRIVPESRPVLVVSGLLTIVVGIMFVIWPTSLSMWVAAFAMVRAITLIFVGFMSRV